MAAPKKKALSVLVAPERLAAHVYVVRGVSVMLDSELAVLYRVLTKNLNLAVRRNPKRFPDDFMFQLTAAEADALRLQIATSIPKRGGRRYLPYAFTEQGVAMLSSVLKSARAAEVNVAITRTFVKIRRILSTNEVLARRVAQHDRQISVLFEHVQRMLEPPPSKRKPIGFVHAAR